MEEAKMGFAIAVNIILGSFIIFIGLYDVARAIRESKESK
jgi:hypothetical protein